MIKRLVAIPLSFLVSLIVSGIATYLVVVRPMRRSWGIDPDEAARTLPGDDFVPAAGITDTRGISIDAAAEAVWPWLPQMGYGRAGWYSYDRLDERGRSATRLMPEFATLAVGDIVPTWPGGGFRVEAIDPGRSLVLYLDTELANAQADEAAAAAGTADARTATGANLKAVGAMGGASMPVFKASWAFVIEPVDATHSRLIERFRVWSPEPTRPQRAFLPMLGLGVFVMTRKQMLGLKERAERTVITPAAPAAPAITPAEPPRTEGARGRGPMSHR